MDYKELALNIRGGFEALSAEERAEFLRTIACGNDTAEVLPVNTAIPEGTTTPVQKQEQPIEALLMDANTHIFVVDENSAASSNARSPKRRKIADSKNSNSITIFISKAEKRQSTLLYNPINSAWLVAKGATTIFVIPRIANAPPNVASTAKRILNAILPSHLRVQHVSKPTRGIVGIYVKLQNYHHTCLYMQKIGWDIQAAKRPEYVFGGNNISRNAALECLKQHFRSEIKLSTSSDIKEYYLECFKFLEYIYK